MKRFSILPAAMLVALTACGGGESSNQMPANQPEQTPAAQQPAQQAAGQAAQADPSSAPMETPDWFKYDKASNTVTMTITAGLTDAKNHWNYNGAHDGNMIITVPQGAKVTIDFKNDDPAMAHSIGIVDKVGGYSATPTLDPVFDGAVSTPHSATDGLAPGKSETINFTAANAGNYAAICYMAGHAATGMWIHFNVSADGKAGVQSASS